MHRFSDNIDSKSISRNSLLAWYNNLSISKEHPTSDRTSVTLRKPSSQTIRHMTPLYFPWQPDICMATRYRFDTNRSYSHNMYLTKDTEEHEPRANVRHGHPSDLSPKDESYGLPVHSGVITRSALFQLNDVLGYTQKLQRAPHPYRKSRRVFRRPHADPSGRLKRSQ